MNDFEIDIESTWYVSNAIINNIKESPGFKLNAKYCYAVLVDSCGPKCRINWFGKDEVEFSCEAFSIMFRKDI